MNPRPLGGTRPLSIDRNVASAVPRVGSKRPNVIASTAAASSQPLPDASPSTLCAIVPSGARSECKTPSRAAIPAAP